MPEVLAIIFVLVVSLGIYLFALLHVAKTAATEDVSLTLKEWQERQAWVDERLCKARLEKWSSDMIDNLIAQQKTAEAHIHSLEHRITAKSGPTPEVETS